MVAVRGLGLFHDDSLTPEQIEVMAKKMQKTAMTPIETILGISPAKADEALSTLTEREQQVVELMATGTKNKKIAEELGISTKTLDIHRANVKWKLQAKTTVDIARFVYAKKFSEHLK
jgi:FixJ family two-component response regulator